MTILVITNRPLMTASNGYDLRVWHLCRALAAHERLVLLVVPLSDEMQSSDGTLSLENIFAETFTSIRIDSFKPRLFRHFRLSEDGFYQWGYPLFQKAVTAQIERVCTQFDIQKMIVFGSNLAELTKPFGEGKRVLLDVCDSVALTIEREISLQCGLRRPFAWLLKQLEHTRWKALEGSTPRWFDHVVTINQRDTETIQSLSDGRANLSTIPNGVAPLFEQAYLESPRRRRAVVFWGNLSFAPNRDAVRYFYEEVYVPYLKSASIGWCIIGKDPDPFLIEASIHDKNLRLLGYVEDLRKVLIDYPIMVNPMRSGSGMKNKVLEAHAMGLSVVSSPLGMESINGAMSGVTYMSAETPQQFFDAVQSLLNDECHRTAIQRAAQHLVLEKYTWKTIDAQWVDLVNQVFSPVGFSTSVGYSKKMARCDFGIERA